MNIERFKIDDRSVEAFNNGFSDYIVRLPVLTKDNFEDKVIYPNNTKLKYSSICMDNKNTAGIILAGNEGTTTMINAMCLVPEYRGSGAAKLLMDETARLAERGILELEVFKENARAIGFYKKYGFETIDKLSYFAGRVLEKRRNIQGEIRDISFNELVEVQNYIDEKVNWQSRIYNILNQNITARGFFLNDVMLGFIVYSENLTVSIKQIFVIKEARKRGIGYKLLKDAAGNKLCSCIFIDNPSGKAFFKCLNFSEKMNLLRMQFII
jgi:ribosomal protein S18 acetylase RimI-like enzyme